MEEKKLTDEVIVKAYFVDCKKRSCETCQLGDIENCQGYIQALIYRLQGENTELQKQVDELTEERENMQDVILGLEDKLANVLLGIKADEVLIAKGVEQAVKDTAKEIWEDCIDEIMRGCGDDKEFWVMKILIETFKKYGVGVEVE